MSCEVPHSSEHVEVVETGERRLELAFRNEAFVQRGRDNCRRHCVDTDLVHNKPWGRPWVSACSASLPIE